MNNEIDWFFEKDSPWQAAYKQLRAIVLSCNMKEELKWGCPCYTENGKNVVLIHGFKDYCALLFHKGALLKDPEKILIQQTANVQSARQIRFTNVKEITRLKPILKAYILEAIQVEKAGLQVTMKMPAEFAMADEFKKILKAQPAVKKAFEALTPGRQRAYLLHFSQPKLATTRLSRVEKSVPRILAGKGLDD
ncbi:MAG TPA: DUF1801 domain-containing protein [Flavihumibacter sp.]|nr:DUF1801 domain-containing protein [Flavihumibacter sp.]